MNNALTMNSEKQDIDPAFQHIILRFLIYRVVSRFSFYVPVYIVALLSTGFSFQEVGFILCIYGISTMIWGKSVQKVLNKKGAALTIAYGELFKFSANIITGLILLLSWKFGSIFIFIALGIAQILGGAGYCFAAIGDGSYLSNAAMTMQMPKEIQSLAQAKTSSYMFIAFLVAGCVGAITFQLVPSLPFFMTSFANMVAAIIAIAWLRQATSPVKTDISVSQTVVTQAKIAFMSYVDIFSYAFLRTTVLILQLLILPVWFFLGLKIDVAFFGFLFGLYTLSGFLGGRFYPYFLKNVSSQIAITIVMIINLLSMLIIGFSSLFWVKLLAPIGVFCTAGMIRPAFLPILNDAKNTSNSTINVVAQAEQCFGGLSALAYFIGGMAFQIGYSAQQIILNVSGMMVCVLILRAILIASHKNKTNSRK